MSDVFPTTHNDIVLRGPHKCINKYDGIPSRGSNFRGGNGQRIHVGYRGRRQSLLPARETNLTACGLKILRQIILPARKLNPGPCSARLTV